MKTPYIIVSDKNRSLGQTIIAALLFTTAFVFLFYVLITTEWSIKDTRPLGHHLKTFTGILIVAIGFVFQKSVYIDLERSRFRNTFEIGPIKLGQWKTIKNYEYVSVFHQPLENKNKIFEVNLWYDTNKHWELYEENDASEAFSIAFEISEQLNIDLLDATVPNDYRWIDKEKWKQKYDTPS